ncbi:MAG: oligosaccharide flippase family protein [Phycisphaerales bacterium]|nr:oligosaccharide flippase family protein [Phycisphaerales bacterium]MCB9862499.1 oligosaccharide flippase family protein [Phycisphaerales bacterium]
MLKLRSFLFAERKFNVDVGWNVGSLAVVGLGGVAVNVVVAQAWGAGMLGVFNQVFAAYIILSQIAVGAVHLSALKYVSQTEDVETRGRVVASALLLSALLGGLTSTIAWLGSGALGRILNSPDVGVGLVLAAPGLLFFSLNKVLINVLNAMRHMRAYAVLQALRLIFMAIVIVAMAALDRPGEQLPLALSGAEALLFLISAAYVELRCVRLRPNAIEMAWLRTHLSFGVRGFLSGMLAELNTRVDVLMLGFLLNDKVVGIYSLAAIPAEGFAQIPLMVRRNFDPIIGASLAAEERSQLETAARGIKRTTYSIMLALGLAGALLFPVFVWLFVRDRGFGDSSWVFAILVAGIVANAGYRPFLGMLLQAGRPATHTLLMCAVVLTNIAMNFALIPPLGVFGAATATAIALLVEAILIARLTRSIVGIRV